MNTKDRTIKTIAKFIPPSILFQLKKMHYVSLIKKYSENDEPDFLVVKYLLEPGDFVLDIGANVGYFSKMLSESVGENGKVFSFEPVPTTFRLLSHSLKKIGLKNVELHNCAMSSSIGTALMEVPKWDVGGDNYYRASIIESRGVDSSLKHYNVDLISIDSLFSDQMKKITFIKCDVEGHEFQVIQGAKNVMAEVKPAWLIEVSEDPDDTASTAYSLFEILQNLGYSAWLFSDNLLKKRSVGDTSINYFFLSGNHIEALRNKKIPFNIEN